MREDKYLTDAVSQKGQATFIHIRQPRTDVEFRRQWTAMLRVCIVCT